MPATIDSLATMVPQAVPVFVRRLQQMQATATLKHQKVSLRNEGIDVVRCGELAPRPRRSSLSEHLNFSYRSRRMTDSELCWCVSGAVTDPMYYLDGDKYLPLTREAYAKITAPNARM